MKAEKQIAVLFVVVAILLVFGFLGMQIYQKNRYSNIYFEYNGFELHKIDDSYGIPIYKIKFFINEGKQPYSIGSRYNPKDLENISVYKGLREDLVKDSLFVTMNPNLSGKATIAYSEINRVMENPFLFRLPTFPALLKKVEKNDLPMINCNGVNETLSVIEFRTGGDNTVLSENGCVILNAIDEEGLIMLADRLVLTVLGIMNP